MYCSRIWCVFVRMLLNVIQTFVWLRMALFGEMAFGVDFKYERNMFRHNWWAKNCNKVWEKKTKITFILGRLYCFVNYLFCCWRQSPMRLFHKWWRLRRFFFHHFQQTHCSCHSDFLVATHFFALNNCRFHLVGQAEKHSTQHNAIPFSVSDSSFQTMCFGEI